MKKAITTALVALASWSLTSSAFAGDATKGEAMTAICAGCHAADGNSAIPMNPKLAGLGEKYLFTQLKAIKAGERNVQMMTGLLDALSEEDLSNIAAYYASKPTQLSGSQEFEVRLNSGAMVPALELGAKLYRAGNLETGVPACSGCHSPRGLGNAPAGFPRLSGQHADYIETQLKNFRAGERQTDGEARIMRSVAKLLSDSEIKALANYVAGLN